MSLLSAFNNQLGNLSKNLTEMYPNDPDISFSNTALETLKKSNPRKLYEMCSSHLTHYEAEIASQNDMFFLQNDFVETNGESSAQTYTGSIINNLKKYWTDMDRESQDNIWKYLNVLIAISNKIQLTT